MVDVQGVILSNAEFAERLYIVVETSAVNR